jgi:UDP-3-O-[3-hydroxymyristoyl] glucosamine N-acyltransferase
MLRASELAAACDADIVGNAERLVSSVAPLAIARPCDLAWVGGIGDLATQVTSSKAGVLLVPSGAVPPDCDATLLVCRDFLSAREAAIATLERRAGERARNQHGTPVVDSSASLGHDVLVSQFAVVGPDSVVGAASWIGPNCVIESAVEIGERCRIGPGSIIGAGTRIGDDCTVGPGAMVGSPPDAYQWSDGGTRAALACGVVVLGDRVLVGAGTVIQRGVEKATVVGAYTAIGSQCTIGHDSRVGMHSMVGAQSGLAANCDVGDHVLISVQVGIGIAVRVGDGARLSARSGVMRNVPAGETWMGSPAEPKMAHLRGQVIVRRLAARNRQSPRFSADPNGSQ